MASDNRTVEIKALVLEHRQHRLSILHAARAAGVARSTIYEWMKLDPDFADKMRQAKEAALDALEDSLYERARAKDTLAGIFLLKHNRPEVYAERPQAGPPQINITIDKAQLNLAHTAAIEARQLAEAEDSEF